MNYRLKIEEGCNIQAWKFSLVGWEFNIGNFPGVFARSSGYKDRTDPWINCKDGYVQVEDGGYVIKRTDYYELMNEEDFTSKYVESKNQFAQKNNTGKVDVADDFCGIKLEKDGACEWVLTICRGNDGGYPEHTSIKRYPGSTDMGMAIERDLGYYDYLESLQLVTNYKTVHYDNGEKI